MEKQIKETIFDLQFDGVRASIAQRTPGRAHYKTGVPQEHLINTEQQTVYLQYIPYLTFLTAGEAYKLTFNRFCF